MEISTVLVIIVVALVFFLLGRLVAELRFRTREESIRKDAVQRSRAVLGGQFSEQLAPYLPDFPYKPTEVKFLGKPVDFIVFEGLDEKKVDRVVFVEVKSGNATLSPTEKTLHHAIEAGSVAFEIYRAPAELTQNSGKRLKLPEQENQ